MPRILDADLNQLRDHVLRMGGEVEALIGRTIRALMERDTDLALQVLEDDNRIDAMELEADRICIRVLALKAPEARDLRLVMTAARITPVLERIADHACNIAREAVELNKAPEVSLYLPVPGMSDIAREMLGSALNAFADSDAAEARRVIDRDDELDRMHEEVYQELLDLMKSRTRSAGQASRMILVIKHLERIGDYVKDICEQIVFMKEATVIKHSQIPRPISSPGLEKK